MKYNKKRNFIYKKISCIKLYVFKAIYSPAIVVSIRDAYARQLITNCGTAKLRESCCYMSPILVMPHVLLSDSIAVELEGKFVGIAMFKVVVYDS